MFEVQHDNTSKLTYVSSDDSDQLGHPPCLISFHCKFSGWVLPKMFVLLFLGIAVTDHTERMIRLI